eukprot:281297-Pleurochrysis_carterae.AAC.2
MRRRREHLGRQMVMRARTNMLSQQRRKLGRREGSGPGNEEPHTQQPRRNGCRRRNESWTRPSAGPKGGAVREGGAVLEGGAVVEGDALVGASHQQFVAAWSSSSSSDRSASRR